MDTERKAMKTSKPVTKGKYCAHYGTDNPCPYLVDTVCARYDGVDIEIDVPASEPLRCPECLAENK